MFGLFNKESKNSNHFQSLSQKLGEKREGVIKEFENKHEEVKKWAEKKGVKTGELAQKGARGLAAGVATSAVIMSGGVAATAEQPKETEVHRDLEASNELEEAKIETGVVGREDVAPKVREVLKGQNLYDERTIEKKLSETLKIPVLAELEGIRLNATYGIMGYESHLTRYPGDNLSTHFESEIEYKNFAKAHMAGGPGAWGYIAPSREDLSNKDIQREKYYLVAQTWLSPNWGTPEVKQWFRHRKMLAVNPVNGRVVVGVLEDAGPAESTRKQFGGSPEAYEELGLFKTGPRVLMYFVDDPNDQIPLGRYGI